MFKTINAAQLGTDETRANFATHAYLQDAHWWVKLMQTSQPTREQRKPWGF